MNSISDRSSSDELAAWLARREAGDSVAVERLLDRLRPFLLAVAQRELGSDMAAKVGASDIVQETIIEAQRDFAQFRGQSKKELRAWLKRIVLNNVKNTRRHLSAAKRSPRQGRELSLDRDSAAGLAGVVAAPGRTPSSLASQDEILARLPQAMASLPPADREVIELYHGTGLTFRDVADRLGCSADAARMRWYRALDRLKTLLSFDDDPGI